MAYCSITLQEDSFHWIFNFAIWQNQNLLNFNPAHYNNFRYVSMTVYMIEIENKNSLIFTSVSLTALNQIAKFFVYFYPAGYRTKLVRYMGSIQ